MDRYHIDIDPISKTQLAVFYDDPEQFRRIYIDESLSRPEVGRAGLIGKVVHGWLLEQRPLSEMVVRIPDDCLSKSGSIVRARLDAFLGSSTLMPVKAAVYAELEHAISEWGPQLQAMFDGAESSTAFEHIVDATVDGVRVKCRPDVWVTRGPLHRLHDIKVSDRIDDRSFARSAREYKYWMQDAHYCGAIDERAIAHHRRDVRERLDTDREYWDEQRNLHDEESLALADLVWNILEITKHQPSEFQCRRIRDLVRTYQAATCDEVVDCDLTNPDMFEYRYI